MKWLFSFAVVFLALIIMSCDENISPEQELNYSAEKTSSSEPIIIDGSLNIDRMLNDPLVSGGYYTIQGEVQYVLKLFKLPTTPAVEQFDASLEIELSSIFGKLSVAGLNSGSNNMPTFVDDSSIDKFKIRQYDLYRYSHAFKVKGGVTGLVLICDFIVTTESVYLDRMYLSEVDG